MRKAFAAVLVTAALSMLLLASCKTTAKTDRVLSEDECSYTLKLVLQEATDRAIPDMFLSMNELKDSMVMSDYGFLNDLRLTIPGMDRLLYRWDANVTASVLPSFDLFSSYLETMAEDIVFTEPVSMVVSGLTSISDFLLETEGKRMADVIGDQLTGLDVQPWRQVAIQYNSWASTREKLYGEKAPRIDDKMADQAIIEKLSSRLVEIYIDHLKSAEVLIRTTPNANMDPVAARVLGLE